MNHDDFVHRVLSAFSFDHCESLFWRVDGEYAPVSFFAQVSDVFWWGTADLEPITLEDVDALDAAFRDAAAACKSGDIWGPELFAARKRGMRPQGAFYKDMDVNLRVLFDACGPEREVDITNPRKPPTLPGGDS